MRAPKGNALRRILAASLTALAAAACAPTVSTHGHQLDPDLLARIQPGTTSREEVTRILGSPSTTGTFDGESWFYVSQRNEATSFYQADVTEQDVVRVDFDANGIVKDVRQHGLELAQDIKPDPNRTRTLGNELTLVQQFIGNIGRFNSNPEVRPEGQTRPGG
jgi:outer membrane protein assembly factor BamE (lipoprotein component of BamABCDE complex)